MLEILESELGIEHGSREASGAVDVDVKLAQMIIRRHIGAIALAEAAKERSQHAEFKGLEEPIINARKREIGLAKEPSREHDV